MDTGHYVAIATDWYEYPRYVFFPAYPVLCKIIGTISGDYWISAFIISFFCGLASVPVFQLVCENYMPKYDAMVSTLLAMTFPYVFLFTTVSYSESLFLLSTLAAWYMHLKQRYLPSALAATLATLTRTYGIAIIIPIVIGQLTERHLRRILLLLLPIGALLGWMYYLYIATGDALAFSTQQAYWDVTLGNKFNWVKYYILPFLGTNKTIPDFNYLEIALVIFVGYLVLSVFRIDLKLGVYSILLFLGLLYFGNFISFPRFFAFIFPIWLLIGGRIRSIPLLAVAVAFFMLCSLIIWSQFILAIWVS